MEDEPARRYRPDYLTAKLRRSRYNVARSMGLDTKTAERIKDWSRNKFILYLYNMKVKSK